MSKKIYRKDKTCLNCNHVVDQKFCPNCGQENTDTRKTFHHLFLHFFEDLTHYENAFWRTIKNLLFKPASLTKEYLSGKRLSYLAPVRLYIFISFVTFLLIAIIPSEKEDKLVKISKVLDGKTTEQVISKEEKIISDLKKEGIIDVKEADSIQNLIKIAKENKSKPDEGFMNFGYHSIKQMDSIRKINPKEINDFEYWINKKTITVTQNNTKEEIIEKGLESAQHNFPKVLLLYMPLFAFFLWLFHNKKRWYYFDHGIFTLHYFSFLLLLYLVMHLTLKFFGLFPENLIIKFANKSIKLVGGLWMFYYFFPAHHRFYGETRFISFIKSMFLFFINMICITFMLLAFFVYTIINIH